MDIEELKIQLGATGLFSPATVEYWCEWFLDRGTLPPNAEEAAAWISDMETQLWDIVTNCTVVESWRSEN